MTTRSRDPKGDRRSAPKSPPVQVKQTSPKATPFKGPSPHLPKANADSLQANLAWFMEQPHGWLRIVPEIDSGEIYLKWKLNSGDWENHYVMVRCMRWQLDYGVALLRYKLEEVLEGIRRPTMDRPFA